MDKIVSGKSLSIFGILILLAVVVGGVFLAGWIKQRTSKTTS